MMENEGMAWHSDAESQEKWRIASMSFKLIVLHSNTKKAKKRFPEYSKNGSLLVMKDETQSHWLHRLPPPNLL
jgi:alkylated DNA repair dioxygenase AlkB